MANEPNRAQDPIESTKAFVDFVVQWEQSLFVTAYRILGNSADAEEARQNVLLRVLGNPQRIPETGLEPWVRRCLINEALALLRKRKREWNANKNHSVSRNGFASAQMPVFEQGELSLAIQEALTHLPPEVRGLLSLRFDDGLTIREIAAVVEQPHTTIQSRLQSAYHILRTKLVMFVNE